MKNNPIAFFDSGVGGLTVYSKLKSLLPKESYIYFGDTKHMPYGEKTEAELLEYADKILDFFIQKRAKAVVMACNTTSSVIYEKIKDKYDLKIYPIIQSTANLFASLPISKIGIFATPATVKSNVYQKEINKHNPQMLIHQIACPDWVRIVEENRINQPHSLLQIKEKMEEMLEFKPDKIVLGCTHYPYLMNILSKYAPKEIFIDPAVYFAEFIKNDLKSNDLISTSNAYEEIYVSSNPENFKTASKMFYTLKSNPQLALYD